MADKWEYAVLAVAGGGSAVATAVGEQALGEGWLIFFREGGAFAFVAVIVWIFVRHLREVNSDFTTTLREERESRERSEKTFAEAMEQRTKDSQAWLTATAAQCHSTQQDHIETSRQAVAALTALEGTVGDLRRVVDRLDAR